jgi:RsiW-degrading membrane proteinase PrsW (M82 family)
MSRDDPVKAVLGDREDLYDVASWDVRSRLDGVAVGLYLALATMRTRLLVVLGLVLFTGQLGTILLLVLQQPVLGVLGLVSVVPALALAAYLWYDDPTRREPLEPLAVTFALGIVLAAIAAVVNTALFSTFAVVPVVGLPLFFFWSSAQSRRA